MVDGVLISNKFDSVLFYTICSYLKTTQKVESILLVTSYHIAHDENLNMDLIDGMV